MHKPPRGQYLNDLYANRDKIFIANKYNLQSSTEAIQFPEFWKDKTNSPIVFNTLTELEPTDMFGNSSKLRSQTASFDRPRTSDGRSSVSYTKIQIPFGTSFGRRNIQPEKPEL